MSKSSESVAVCLDIGGTNVRVACVNTNGEVLKRARYQTEPTTSCAGLAEGVARLTKTFLAKLPLANCVVCVSVGFAGLTDGIRGIVHYAPNVGGLSGIDLQSDLEEYLGLKVTVDNDANCAVLGECWRGAGVGEKSVFMFTLGTGIGGGMVLDGALWTGADGIAGEIGHTIVDFNGPSCACGNRGCLEALASGTAIVRGYSRRKHVKGGLNLITAKEVVGWARSGDKIATDVISRAGEALGVGIANVYNLINPKLILIGGGVSKAGRLLLEPAVNKARSLIVPRLRGHLRVRRGMLGDDAGIVGAAYVGFKRTGIETFGDLC